MIHPPLTLTGPRFHLILFSFAKWESPGVTQNTWLQVTDTQFKSMLTATEKLEGCLLFPVDPGAGIMPTRTHFSFHLLPTCISLSVSYLFLALLFSL